MVPTCIINFSPSRNWRTLTVSSQVCPTGLLRSLFFLSFQSACQARPVSMATNCWEGASTLSSAQLSRLTETTSSEAAYSSYLRVAPKPGPYQCAHCPKSFLYGSRLREHEKSHIDERPFVCHLCPYRAKLKSNLARHLKMHCCREQSLMPNE